MPTSFRAERVGSLLRPPQLLQARAAHATGSLPLDELRAVEDRAILSDLEKAKRIGTGCGDRTAKCGAVPGSPIWRTR